MKWSIVLPGLLAVAGGAFAQDANEEAARRQAEQLVASLHWKEGQIAVPAADIASSSDIPCEIAWIANCSKS